MTYGKNSIIKILLFLCMLTACNVSEEEKSTLMKAERQMEQYPDSAFHTLNDSALSVSDWSRRGRMRYHLLLTRAKNSTDRPLPSDSTFRKVVDYYDSHGSSNERMLAHYLLGCIYRDRNEAPQAIQCYNDAVDCADTLNADCDYGVLYRIYGQMSEVYEDQFLYEEALEASDKNIYYAYKDGNLYDYLHGQELKIPIYYSLGDTSYVIKLTNQCSKLYKKYDMPQKAAGAYCSAIYVYMRQEQYKKAHELMNIFETQSDAFDENHNIEQGRESYYYLKGWFFQSTSNIDSAEYYYRKLLSFSGHDYEANKGLLNVYKSRQNTDSIIKYADLCEISLDSLLTRTSTQAVAHVKGVYDYCRNQKIAKEKSLEAQNAWFTVYILVILGICAVVAFYLLFRRYRQKTRMEISIITSDYIDTKTNLGKATAEYALMKTNYQAFCDSKEKEIRLLQKKVDEYEEKDIVPPLLYDNNVAMNSDIVKKFRIMSHPKRNVPSPSNEDWEKLIQTIKNCIHSFYTLVACKSLTEKELYVCTLVFLDFSNSEIASLLDTTPQVITNTKSKVNSKLFGKAGASSLKGNLISSIHTNK